MSHLHRTHPIHSTPDLPRLLAFYTGGLAAEETYRFPDDGAPGHVAPEVAGARRGSPPTDMPWAERVADLHDPDGNHVHVAHPLG